MLNENTENNKTVTKTLSLIEAHSQISALDVFSCSSIDKIISDIESEVLGVVPDISTAGGRKDVASLAHKVSKTKVALDSLGKGLVADWKQRAKTVDVERKKMRDSLEALRDKAREPLTIWEDAEKEKEAKAKLDLEILECHGLAIKEDSIIERERALALHEELLRQAEIKLEQEAAAKKAEADRAEREEKLKKDAAEFARLEAERAAKQKIADSEALVLAAEASVIAERLQKEKELNELSAKLKRDADEKEATAKRKAEAEAALAKKKAGNKAHQTAVNNSILASLTALNISEQKAKLIICCVADGDIKFLEIRY